MSPTVRSAARGSRVAFEGAGVADPALARGFAAAAHLCPPGSTARTVRHHPGRQATALAVVAGMPAVLKVFAEPRAQGIRDHLLDFASAFARSGPPVPRPIAADPDGHALLVEYVEGTTLTDLDGARFLDAVHRSGAAVGAIHRSGVGLDRVWSAADEIALVRSRLTPGTAGRVQAAADAWEPPPGEPLQPSHKDCHPGQVIVDPTGEARWIDFDEAAVAPAGLDAGNFVAHLVRDAVIGARDGGLVHDAIAAFLDGYRRATPLPPTLVHWTALNLARLGALAELRHARPDRAGQILDALERFPAGAPEGNWLGA